MKFKITGFVFIFIFVASSPALAYIDPGSGSAIMSAIVGFFVAAGLVVKTYWYKIKSLFSSNKQPDNKNKN